MNDSNKLVVGCRVRVRLLRDRDECGYEGREGTLVVIAYNTPDGDYYGVRFDAEEMVIYFWGDELEVVDARP